MSGSPDLYSHPVDGSEVVIRASEAEDSLRTTAVTWAVGWRQPSIYHRVWPEADTDWQENRYYREFVAEVDGVIAARVGLEAYRQPFAELIDLSVRPEYRRRGLGKLLTKACQRQASRRGFPLLFLQTEINNHAAHHLYSSEGFVPTAHGNMLRMLKFLDYPLLDEFRRTHPLTQYTCAPAPDALRAWNMEWRGYATEDYLRLRLEGGSARSDSEGAGPALTALDWQVEQGQRGLSVRFQRENVTDLEAGHHIELELIVRNEGKRMEEGIFKMLLPFGVQVTSPATNQEKVFTWDVAPGEEVRQPVVIQIEPTFDTSILWYLNYASLPVCMETYWEGHRALLSASLPMAAPPPNA